MAPMVVGAAENAHGPLPAPLRERGDELRAIEFPRIAGGKPFDVAADWFVELRHAIGQG